jgi:hypothetical protein
MKRIVLVAFFAVASVASAQLAGQSAWKAPRTPWGDPDISGLFTTDDELGVPFERPAQFGERAFVTAEEFAQRQTQTERQDEADREAFVAPRPQQAGGPVAGGTGPPAHWIERGRPSRRTSPPRCDCRDADAGRHHLRRT